MIAGTAPTGCALRYGTGFDNAFDDQSMHSSDDSFTMNAESHLDSRIGALMREIDACIDERRDPPVSRAREVLAANHASARMRRTGQGGAPVAASSVKPRASRA